GKSVSVRWHITGDDKETFEDVWTDWLRQSNPCTSSAGSPSGGSLETTTPEATPLSDQTTKPQSPVPTPKASYTAAPDVSTPQQALLDRANRSNHAVTAIYNSLMSRMPANRQEPLKRQQDEWLKMRK